MDLPLEIRYRIQIHLVYVVRRTGIHVRYCSRAALRFPTRVIQSHWVIWVPSTPTLQYLLHWRWLEESSGM